MNGRTGDANAHLGNLDGRPDDSQVWNTLPSELEDELIQKRGATPPDRYRRAIDAYFKRIGAGRNSLQSNN